MGMSWQRNLNLEQVEFSRTHRPDLIGAMEAMPVSKHLGVEVIGLAQGYSALRLMNNPDITFDGRQVMGGVMGTFADMAAVSAAVSARALGWVGSTTSFSINLIAPAAGKEFVALGRMVGQTGSTATAVADVFAVEGDNATVIASCLATARLMDASRSGRS